jgi:nicotinamide riboside kinase
MKIGIMGTHSVGKTTLALRLAARLKRTYPEKSVGLLNEIVRQCPFPVNKKTTPNTQLWIYHKQMSEEIELSAAYDILICDRTVLDGLIYAQWAGFRDIVDDCLNQALSWIDTYSRLYWLRPNGKPVADGFRDTDVNFQQDIDGIMAAWIKQFGISATVVGNTPLCVQT